MAVISRSGAGDECRRTGRCDGVRQFLTCSAALNRHRQYVYCSTDNCDIGGIDNGCLLGRVGRAVPSHPDSAAGIGTRILDDQRRGELSAGCGESGW